MFMPKTIRLEVCPQGDPRIEQLEYEVYSRAGYILPNPQRKVLENEDYPNHDIIAAFVDERLVGSARLVVDPNPRPDMFTLHCFKPFDIWPWAARLLRDVRPDRLMQGGTMVIHEDYRGGPVFQAMFQKMIEWSMRECNHYAVATIDEGFFKRLHQRNVPFIAMGETRYYMGSRTVPAMIARDWVTRGAVPADIIALAQQHAEAESAAATAACGA